MDILISVVLPLSLAFIMFSLGLGLTIADFARVLTRPGAFLIGAVHQVVLLPIVVFGIVLAFGIQAEFAVGFMVLAACPGGVTSNIISKLARADVALSVTLTAVISLLSILTVPLIIAFALGRFMQGSGPQIDVTGTAITMFLLTAVPIALGLVVRRLLGPRAARVEPMVARIATVLFAVIVVAALAANWDVFISNVTTSGPALITMLALLMALGFVIPRMLGRSLHEAKTISIETGIQNASLGITVAALLLPTDGGFSNYALPAAAYGIIMYLAIVPALALFRRLT